MQLLRSLSSVSLLVVLHFYIRPCIGRTSYSDNHIQKRDYPTDPEFPQCDVYCHGLLLHTVQMAHLFHDSKTFVDMKLKLDPKTTLDDFNVFMEARNQTPSQSDIRDFVDEHFDAPGKEFVPWIPNDWKENPSFLEKIIDPDLKQWGNDLNVIWKELGRKLIEDVRENPMYYSIIPVPNPVIVPGGRFTEFYYWDSFWIIRGLLHSQMFDTARGMLENYLSIVERYGFVPNGGRIYYRKRSQPPLLPAMVKSYVEATNDFTFGMNAVEMLEHEFEYWMNNHSVQAKGYPMITYGDLSEGPRPESYSEDIESADIYESWTDREAYWSELKAAAESGMDFTSRWFINKEGTNVGNITDLKTRSIVPVELNAILYWNAKIIEEFYTKAGNASKSKEYNAKAEKILEGIQAVLWNDEAGIWLDYDLLNKKPRNYFVTSNLSPLWTKAYYPANATKISESVLNYIEENDLDSFPGGVPNTLYNTGEQWDLPNVWPPMQYMLVEGLENLNTETSKNLSIKWAHRWVKSNFAAYSESRHMFEKYNGEVFGGYGGGGEYEVQQGFGWTNGVIIEFLAKYGQDIKLSNAGNTTGSKIKLLSFVGMLALPIIATVIGVFAW